jgi:beta-lactamase class A
MIELLAALALCSERVGAMAEILETHQIVLDIKSQEKFPMQSVYKLPIGMAVLAQHMLPDQMVRVDKSDYVPQGVHSPLRDAHPEGADVNIRELLRLAVSESDGSASDVLLRIVGGPDQVMKYLSSVGISGVLVRDPEKAIGADWSVQYRNWATPLGAVGVLRALWESRGLSRDRRELLLKFMYDTTTFPTRLKGLLPPGAEVAHKTGSSGERDGVAAATNDIGIATLPNGRHLAIAVFVSDSPAKSEERDKIIAKIARHAWDQAQDSVQIK